MPMCDPEDKEMRAVIDGFISRLSERAIAMGGNCTGEHGIGQGKQNYIRREHGDAVDVMMMIKSTIDPKGIMNPGKIFPQN